MADQFDEPTSAAEPTTPRIPRTPDPTFPSAAAGAHPAAPEGGEAPAEAGAPADSMTGISATEGLATEDEVTEDEVTENVTTEDDVTERVRAEAVTTGPSVQDRDTAVLAEPEPEQSPGTELAEHGPGAELEPAGASSGADPEAAPALGEPGSLQRRLLTTGGIALGLPVVLAVLVAVLLPQQGLVVALAALVGAGIGFFLLVKKIPGLLAELHDLADHAARIADGDHGHQIQPTGIAELDPMIIELNALADRLQSTDRRTDALIVEVGAQLDAPAAAIEQKLPQLEGKLPEVELRTLRREVRRVRRLGKELGLLVQLEEGRRPATLSEVELTGLVAEVTGRMRPQFEAAGVELHELTPGAIWVQADRRELAQVLVNLLGNALLASADSGGGEVLVGLARTSLAGRSVVRMTVTDNGVGLADDQLEKVFERFHRAPGGRRGPGAGLGLTISRALVRAQDGDLQLSSPGKGRGTTATVTLPLQR